MKKKNYGFKQGKFKPMNANKCESRDLTYRSSWELKFMQYCDLNEKILKWSSEEVVFKYKLNGKTHRYFTDFMIKTRNLNDEIITTIIEIKPYKETQKPIKGKKKQSTFLRECLTYQKNIAKWTYATAACKRRGWIFKILTEKDLFL